MLSSGNGEPNVCALNVLRTLRGECPYTRGMGLGEHIDRPQVSEDPFIRADVSDQLYNYEPRVDETGIGITRTPNDGDIDIIPYITRVYGNES